MVDVSKDADVPDGVALLLKFGQLGGLDHGHLGDAKRGVRYTL